MNAELPRLLDKMPPIVTRLALVQLFRATAAAFQCESIPLAELSQEQRLQAYARFTADRAGDALRRGEDLAGLQERLYRNAYRLGRAPGQILRVRSVEDVMALARFLYGILGIEFQGDRRGQIMIRRCYFSDFYSPEVCRVMSAMDRGLLTGLAGAGDMVFTQRITEGQPCCRAYFSMSSMPAKFYRFDQE